MNLCFLGLYSKSNIVGYSEFLIVQVSGSRNSHFQVVILQLFLYFFRVADFRLLDEFSAVFVRTWRVTNVLVSVCGVEWRKVVLLWCRSTSEVETRSGESKNGHLKEGVN